MIRAIFADPRRFLQYLAVVGAAAVIDLGGFLILERLGVIVPVAAVASFTAAAAFNYSVNARVVFGQRATAMRFGLFFALGLVGLSVNAGVTTLAHFVGFWPVFAKMAGIGVAFVVNTFANYVFVFRVDR